MIVLQSKLSGMFFRDWGCWSAGIADAKRFASREQALQFIVTERLSDVTVAEPTASIPHRFATEW
jgi:hypothetical protein